ncbi:DNA/RNA non-specific endonuclease [Marinospirillum alkaliphilum]|uniref:Endonuclease G n=1 Tax=Marinospirillum alkaliphilum DSM 21637 TaxID=1122209 RepID=A0A1K1ZJ30_9GAMM|nr:DNA/RNA non-specific endonuclease [Marinospirillum alkaliphilum]SFX73700.1 endonuclease G [Marinospirillum alkaliphilum DSM 21637]
MKLRGLLRLPAWLLVVVLLGGGFFYWQEVQQREYHAYAGLPQVQDWKNWQTWHRVLRNPGFMVGYSEFRMNPLWVTYRLEPVEPGPSDPRPQRFQEDRRTFTRVNHDEYTGSGYDRGHLAPNHAMSRVHGREAQLRSFLMTNISPQTPELNRRVWQRIEATALDHFAPIKGEVWVITGPVFGEPTQRLNGSWVEIPAGFYKIFVAPPTAERRLKVLAFLVPQQVRGNEPLDQFLVTVREIEQLTGLNFLHRLPQELQDELETVIHPEPWRLSEVNRRMGRF